VEDNTKGRPTPRRQDQEAARKRPLVTNSKAELRAKKKEYREKAREGLNRGDEKFLPPKERGPQKKFARDYTDARYSVGEFMVPLAVAVVVLSFMPNAEIQAVAIYTFWAFLAVMIIDAAIAGARVQKLANAKWGENVEKLKLYTAMRTIQMRPMRIPKPQVRRGEYPE